MTIGTKIELATTGDSNGRRGVVVSAPFNAKGGVYQCVEFPGRPGTFSVKLNEMKAVK